MTEYLARIIKRNHPYYNLRSKLVDIEPVTSNVRAGIFVYQHKKRPNIHRDTEITVMYAPRGAVVDLEVMRMEVI